MRSAYSEELEEVLEGAHLAHDLNNVQVGGQHKAVRVLRGVLEARALLCCVPRDVLYCVARSVDQVQLVPAQQPPSSLCAYRFRGL